MKTYRRAKSVREQEAVIRKRLSRPHGPAWVAGTNTQTEAALRAMQICQATTPEEIAAVRGLFQEYAAWLRVDLCFQGFSQELATLPGAYAPPRGRLLLASTNDEPAGCVALRPFARTACEMKRLFVRPAHRGHGLGERLAKQVIAEAKVIGYSAMVLDTLPSMHHAIRLYEQLGFARRAAYYDTPLPETVFMELLL